MDALLGYLVALTLSLLSVAGFATWAKFGVQNVQTAATSSQMVIVDKATQQYVQDNAATIAMQSTASAAYPISVGTLIVNGYLPVGFSEYNLFGQRWQAQVLHLANGQLQTLVTSQGGRPIADTKQLVQIAAQVGAQGGFVPYAKQAGDAAMSPTTAQGAYGGWSLPLDNYQSPGSGHLASLLAFTSAGANNEYLYRVTVPEQPTLNQMRTALDMGANDINAAGNVRAAGVSVQNASSDPMVAVGNASMSYTNAGKLQLTADDGTQIKNAGGGNAPLTAGDITGGILQPTTPVTEGNVCGQAGAIGKSNSGPLFCQSGVWQGGELLQVFTGTVVPNVCSGGMLASDWTCGSGPFYIDITFPQPFRSPPQVSSSISTIGPYSPCMEGGMDAVYTMATNVTTTGFRLYGAASPVSSASCTYNSQWGTATTSYIAVGLKQ